MWIEVVILCLILYGLYKSGFFVIQRTKSIENDISIRGQVVVVTGATGCIGSETALQAAQRGAKVILACRNMKRAAEVRQDIASKCGNDQVECLELDLSSMKSVRKFAKELLRKEDTIDVLVNNAGVFACPFQLTEDDLEMQFAVNYVGMFLLTMLLLPALAKAEKGRIVNVTSLTYQYGTISLGDLNSPANYNRFSAYANSKLAVLLFTRKLAKLLKSTDITVNCSHPGIVITDIIRNLPCPDSLIYKIASKVGVSLRIFDTVEQAADNDLRCAVDKRFVDSTGNYFVCGDIHSISEKVMDALTAEELWYYTLNITGLKKYKSHEDFACFSKNICCD